MTDDNDEEEGDGTRDVGEEGEDDVEEEVAAASADQQNLWRKLLKLFNFMGGCF